MRKKKEKRIKKFSFQRKSIQTSDQKKEKEKEPKGVSVYH